MVSVTRKVTQATIDNSLLGKERGLNIKQQNEVFKHCSNIGGNPKLLSTLHLQFRITSLHWGRGSLGTWLTV